MKLIVELGPSELFEFLEKVPGNESMINKPKGTNKDLSTFFFHYGVTRGIIKNLVEKVHEFDQKVQLLRQDDVRDEVIKASQELHSLVSSKFIKMHQSLDLMRDNVETYAGS